MGRIDRNTSRLLIAAAAVFIVLVVASSGDAVQVWREPSPGGSEEGGDRGRRTEPQGVTPATLPPEEVGDLHSEWLTGIAIVLLSILAIMVIWSLATTFPRMRLRRRPPTVPLPPGFASLPGADAPEVVLDEGAQLDALLHGSPRNGIVECWLQMEEDVARAGLPRHAAETSTEYTTRVLASTALDPTPVHQLAALYREARFSRHRIDQSHRERAVEAVVLIHRALATVSRDTSTAQGSAGPG